MASGKPPAEQVVNAGPWVLERTLGSGGFGAVYLYKNKVTRCALAVKQCRQYGDLSEKNRTRWSQECEIMLRLDHPNVVRGLELPDELKVLATSDMPVLAMEFCELGDLRRVLNRPENCCGLPEFQVRHVVNDISSAVEYLHSKRVIHRDLKPENIVMHNPGNSRVLYKLIDLGYAKDLTNDSMCTSFVGTLQYLAPELFSASNPKYTCTVDYWSLGTTIFECIVGIRPFLANLPPVRWLGVVSKKRPEHIHAFMNEDNKLEYSDKLPSPNQLSSLTQVYFEQWLRLMLLWDPKNRGQKQGGPMSDRHRPHCFEFLDKMLTTKQIHIYSVPTNDLIACAMNAESEVQSSTISTILQSSTHVDRTDQELLTPTGKVVDLNEDLVKYCVTQEDLPDKDTIDLYLFSKSGSFPLIEAKKRKMLPRQLQMLLDNRDMDRLYADQVEVCKYAIYYCTQMSRDIGRLIDAQRAAKLSLMNERTELSVFIIELNNEFHQLVARIEFYNHCCETDLAEFLHQQQSTGTFSQKMYDAWASKRTEMNKYLTLKESLQSLELLNEDLGLQFQELEHSHFARDVPSNQLPGILETAKKIYEHLRGIPQDQRLKASCTPEIIRCIEDSINTSNRLTSDLDGHIRKLISCKLEVIQLKRRMQAMIEKIVKAKDDVLSCQRQRQKDIWRLLTTVTTEMKKEKHGGVPGNSLTPGDPTSPSDNPHDPGSIDRDKFINLVHSLRADHEQYMMTSMAYDWSFLDV